MAEPDVLDCADGVEEEPPVELLHQRPVQQLAPHVHHRPVPGHPPATLIAAPPRPALVRRHAALPLQLLRQRICSPWASAAADLSCWAESCGLRLGPNMSVFFLTCWGVVMRSRVLAGVHGAHVIVVA